MHPQTPPLINALVEEQWSLVLACAERREGKKGIFLSSNSMKIGWTPMVGGEGRGRAIGCGGDEDEVKVDEVI
ncbi:hypothetical protein TorRG33x02_002760 [Trema orientale]|uniref:Uncharacterized protein n=1 Tax=Trema orientale TaxID=63057 RepID=A0A2P5G1R7_TREOI|nr:hypothetical protein TorRG33x02_002760 [Trema orientale]